MNRIDWAHLNSLALNERRDVLVGGQPADLASQGNWWRYVLEVPKSEAARGDSLAECLEWVARAHEVLDLVDDLSVFTDVDETLLERAQLVVSLVDRFGVADLPEWLRCADLIDELLRRMGNPDEAERRSVNWRSRPIREIRSLNRIRHLLRPLRWLRPLADADEQELIGKWIEVAHILP